MNTTDPNALDPLATTTPPPALAPTVDLMSEPPLEEIIEEWNRYHDDLSAGKLTSTSGRGSDRRPLGTPGHPLPG